MRVTFLSWRDTGHPDGGGSEVFVEEIAGRLAARGHEVTILTARYPGAAVRERRNGVLHIRRGGRLTVYPRALLHLLTRTGRRQDAVVEVINGLPFAARLVRRRGLVALVHHLHREQWRMIYPGLGGWLGWTVESRITPRLYRHVPHVTVSQPSRADLADLGIPAEHVTVIRNGSSAVRVDVERSDTPRLCTLGRLVPHKQIEHALDTIAALRARGTDVPLDVIGSGWWEPTLLAYTRSLGVADLVTFHGHVDDRTRDELLARAWLHLLPSVKEGWGRAVIDAAAQGTATIAYAGAGGVRDSIEDGVTGELVSNRAEFIATTAALIEQGRETCSAWGRRAEERSRRYDWGKSTEEFELLLSPGRRR